MRAGRHDLQMLLVVVIWGVNFPITKWALGLIDALAFNALRFVFAVMLLGLLASRVASLAPRDGWTRDLVWKIVGLGLLGNVTYQALFIIGIAKTSSGNSALLIASAPIWTAIFAHLGGVELLRRRAAAGLLLAFGGVASIVLGKHGLDFSSETAFGDLISVVAASCWGGYTVLSKPLLNRIDATPLAFWSVLAALPGLWLLGGPRLELAPLRDPWLWAAILFSGTLSVGLAYALWNAAVAHVGPSQTAVYGNLVPVVALIASWVWLREPIGGPQLVGATLILGGLQLVRSARQKPVGE